MKTALTALVLTVFASIASSCGSANVGNGLYPYYDHSKGAFGFSFPNRTVAVEPTFRDAARLEGGWGYAADASGAHIFDPSGKKTLSIDSGTLLYRFKEGMVMFQDIATTRYGLMKADGTIIVKPEYASIEFFTDGLALAAKDGKWGYVGENGEIAIPFDFDRASSFFDGLAVVYSKDGCYFIDKTGKKAIDASYNSASPFFEGYAAVQIGDNLGIIDRTGKLVVPAIYQDLIMPYGTSRIIGPFVEGFACVFDGRAWGFIDTTGKVVIDFTLSSPSVFSKGIAAFKGGNQLWGFMDKTGATVVEPQFANLPYLDVIEGLIPVDLGEGKIGYFDIGAKKMALEPIYVDARPFRDGTAWVRFSDGTYGHIDSAGKPIEPEGASKTE